VRARGRTAPADQCRAIDLHKYCNALKPIVLTPSLIGYDLFRQTAIWLAVTR
jgi:hypothetical protein